MCCLNDQYDSLNQNATEALFSGFCACLHAARTNTMAQDQTNGDLNQLLDITALMMSSMGLRFAFCDV
jgi:hypothetical protein